MYHNFDFPIIFYVHDVSQGSCNVNIRTSESLTPLHIAAHEGHSAVVELLVGYGADLNATADNGNTPLHLVLARTNMKPLNTNTPYLMQVRYFKHTEPVIVVSLS